MARVIKVNSAFTLCLVLSACGSSTPAINTTPEVPAVSTQEMPVSPLSELNLTARAGAVTDVLHGVEVSDPYRALEEDTEATWAWIDAQNEWTSQYLRRNDDDARSARIETLLSIGYVTGPIVGGDRVFYLKRDGDAEQASLLVLDEGTEQARALLEPINLGEKTAIDWFFPSPSGRYLAYGLSRNGDERSTLYVMDVDSGERLADEIAHTKWAAIAWLHDDSGFYYTRYPAEGEADYDGEAEDTYNRHLFFHALGTAPEGDALVFRSPERTAHLWPQVANDDSHLLVGNWRSWSETDLWVIERGTTEEPIPVVVGEDYVVFGEIRDGVLYAFSNQDHSGGRILTAPVATIADLDTWQEFIPEGEGSIEDMGFTANHIVLSYIEDITSKIRFFNLSDGSLAGEVELPMRGSVSTVATDPQSDKITFAFGSFFHPPTIFEYSIDDGTLANVDSATADIDVSEYELDQVSVTSQDGTEVNVYLVHRADMVPNGNQPVLLGGYGGFSVPMMPSFQRNVLYWLEQGGVYASANIRGGGEHGEAWHADGMLENKHHVFEDFEAVIRWLSDSGLSNPDRIAIIGGSNGGLLMGAMLARCPDAFRATVSSVGLYDMVRFTEFPPAEIWMGEYGNPSEAEAFTYLFDYSPYHNIREGAALPAALVETADQDSRVSWQHSTKFVARLQEATTSPNPLLFYMSRDEGHGVGSGRSDVVERYIRYYTFIETELGVR